MGGQPPQVQVVIDGKTQDHTSVLSNSVFFQNLLPGLHDVSIKKDGYVDYQKNLLVPEKEVAKLENVLLIKKEIAFKLLPATESPFDQPKETDNYILKSNALYYAPVKNTPVSATTPLLKNVASFTISNNAIIWLGLDGVLYRSDSQGLQTTPQTSVPLAINKKNTYQISVLGQYTFLQANDTLYLLDADKQSWQSFYQPVHTVKLSPDGQKITYVNDHEVFIWYVNNAKTTASGGVPSSGGKDKGLLKNFTEKISDVYWLNSDYLILNTDNGIMISEIDERNNVNVVTLPATTLVDGNIMTIKNPKILFDQQTKKLYILTGNTVLVSERLVP